MIEFRIYRFTDAARDDRNALYELIRLSRILMKNSVTWGGDMSLPDVPHALPDCSGEKLYSNRRERLWELKNYIIFQW